MASAWGSSWGSAWGNSWGSVGAPPPPTPDEDQELGGGKIVGVSGGTATRYSRERHREVFARFYQAKEKLERRKVRDAKRREYIRQVTDEAAEVVAIVEARLNASIIAGLQELAAALEAAATAQTQIDAYKQAVIAQKQAELLRDLSMRMRDEEDILALMLS